MQIHAVPIGDLPRVMLIGLGTHGPGILRYRLHECWQLHLYPYACRAELGGVVYDVRPGCATITAPGADMRYQLAGERSHTFAHFLSGGETADIPAMVDLGEAYTGLEQRLREAIAWREPHRAAVRLLDVLLAVAAHGRAARDGDLVGRARDLIEYRLATRLRVRDVARQVGVSHSQLDRRFRSELGMTVLGYMRSRRAARAAHLLASSSLPAAEIARQIGVCDLQALNKLVRRELGRTPRSLRGGG